MSILTDVTYRRIMARINALEKQVQVVGGLVMGLDKKLDQRRNAPEESAGHRDACTIITRDSPCINPHHDHKPASAGKEKP